MQKTAAPLFMLKKIGRKNSSKKTAKKLLTEKLQQHKHEHHQNDCYFAVLLLLLLSIQFSSVHSLPVWRLFLVTENRYCLPKGKESLHSAKRRRREFVCLSVCVCLENECRFRGFCLATLVLFLPPSPSSSQFLNSATHQLFFNVLFP